MAICLASLNELVLVDPMVKGTRSQDWPRELEQEFGTDSV